MKRLSKNDIVEIVGYDDLATLRELEILFQHCEELGALHHCPNLLRLSVIDTGLKRISNLAPLGPSLLTLCICDQDINKMENLDLPNLKELFLHRNQICQIEGLESCPRLRRLWLFQNQITAISGLHALPELEECWLQGNRITSLQGIENSSTLVSFALAGNLIADYSELHRLVGLPSLTSLGLQDVHFGRCPIVDDPGYRNFCTCYLPQLVYLDGVQLSPDDLKVAFLSHAAEVSSYNDRIAAVENVIKAEIDGVEAKQQASKSHLVVLEREMTEAMRELEGLISDGRSSMSKQVKKQKKIMEASFKILDQNITQERNRALGVVNDSLANLSTEHDVAEALFCVLERVVSSELGLLEVFAGCCKLHSSSTVLAYQAIKETSPDFLRMASLLPLNHQFSGVPSAVLLKVFKVGKFNGSGVSANQVDVVDSEGGGGSFSCRDSVECYAIVTLEQLRCLFLGGMSQNMEREIDVSADPIESLVFFTDIAVAVSLFSSSSSASERSCFGNYESVIHHNPLDDTLRSGGVDNMPAFKAAQSAKLMLLISCELDVSLLDIDGPPSHRIRLPASTSARQEMFTDLKKAKKPVAFEIEIPVSKEGVTLTSNIYTVPETLCRQEFAGSGRDRGGSRLFPVNIKFASICLTPILDGIVGIGGIKALESKLELVLTPANTASMGSPSYSIKHGGSPINRTRGHEAVVSRKNILNNNVITDFSAFLSAEVRDYLDRTLEEVTAETAETLLTAEMDVESRSAAIRSLRNQIEEERKAQEALLKKMKSGDDRSSSNHHIHPQTVTSRSAGATQRDRGGYRR